MRRRNNYPNFGGGSLIPILILAGISSYILKAPQRYLEAQDTERTEVVSESSINPDSIRTNSTVTSVDSLAENEPENPLEAKPEYPTPNSINPDSTRTDSTGEPHLARLSRLVTEDTNAYNHYIESLLAKARTKKDSIAQIQYDRVNADNRRQSIKRDSTRKAESKIPLPPTPLYQRTRR